MSKFRDLYKEECKQLVVEVPERPLVCPTCIPNISAPKINWLQQDEPYFDERTCEYIYNFLAPNKVQTIGDFSLKEYVEKVKVYGAKEIFDHFNKEYPKDFSISPKSISQVSFIKTRMRDVLVDSSNLIRIKISIDAIFMDKLKDKVSSLDSNPPTKSDEFPNEILIIDKEADFVLDFETVLIGLSGFQLKQEFFAIENGALLREDSEEKFVVFKYEKLKENLKTFKKSLEKLLETNGYRILTPLNFFTSFKPVVTKIRIELNNEDIQDPMRVNKVFVEFENCPEVELLMGIDVFKRKTTGSKDAIFFMASFENILSDLRATQTKDWLEFTKEYVYPPIMIDYGDNPENTQIVDSGLKCAAIDFDEIIKNILGDLSINPWNILSAEFDKQSCNQDLKKSNPVVKQFTNPKAQQEFVKTYQKYLRIAKRRATAEGKFQQLDAAISSQKDPNETEEEYKARIAEARVNKEQYMTQLEQSASDAAYKKISSDQKDNPEKYSFQKLLSEELDRQKKQKDKADNTVFEIFKSFQEEGSGESEEDMFQKFVNTVGVCGINEGMGVALDCLLKQVTFEDAINSAIKVAFETLPPGGLEGILLFGLDPIKQQELKLLAAKKLGKNSAGEIPWPWETPVKDKQKKAGAALEGAVRKQFVADLKADIEEGDLDAEALFLEEYVKHQDKVENYDPSNPDHVAKVEELTYKALEDKQVNKQLARASTDVSQSTNEVLNSLIDAYVEAIFELLSIDDLIELFYSVPAVKLIVDLFKMFIKCPSKVIHEFQENKIKEFKLDICNPVAPLVNFKIPNLDLMKNPVVLIEEKFIEVVRKTIAKLISYAIKLFLDFLENTLCSALELLGKAALNPDQFFGDFADVMRKAFCPDATDDEAKDLANNLLNKIGAKNDDVSDAVDCLGGALAGSFTQDELISLISDENPDEDLIKRASAAIMIGCPRMADLFGTPDQTRNTFGNFRDLIPENIRERMLGLRGNPFGDSPLYETICLTSEELKNWDDYRRGLLEAAGLDPNDATQQVENYNRRAKEALEELLRNLSENPDREGLQQALHDAISDLLAPNKDRPPGCDLEEGESTFGSKALSEPKDIVRMQDELSDKIMNFIGEQFNREYASNPNIFFPSLLAKIMRDTEGNDYNVHSFFNDFFLTRMDYHNSAEQQAIKEAGKWYQKTFGQDDVPFMGEDRGFYPETVGNELKTQIEQKQEYSLDNINFRIPFKLPEGLMGDRALLNGEYGSVSYKDLVPNPSQDLERVFDYQTFVTVSGNDIASSYSNTQKIDIDPEVLSLIDPLEIQGVPTRAKIFKEFIKTKLSPISTLPIIQYNSVYQKFCEKTFNYIKDTTVSGSQGFMFGYEEEDLTKEQLNYVNPETGSTEYTYTNEDKILGRAQEESDRVFFLNPEEFGGSYKVPPVYIVPKRTFGWKKICSVIAPEEEPCDPKRESLLKFSEIKKRASKVRNSTNSDPRVTKSVDKCFIEKPFDKILNKNAAGGVDSISKMHVRMAAVLTLTTALPAIVNVKFDDINYDDSITDTVYEKLLSDLMVINPFGPRKLELHKYTMLVFEQIIQGFERDIIKSLPEGEIGGHDVSSLPADIQEAYISINQMREDYDYSKILPYPDKIELGPITNAGDIMSNGLLFPYALAYSKYGELIFQDNFKFKYSPPLIVGQPPSPIMPFVDHKLYCKILSIRLILDDVKVIVKKQIKKEVLEILDGFYDELPERIQDMRKHMLTSTSLFDENNIINIGTKNYNDQVQLGTAVDIGNTPEVLSDISQASPWDNSDENNDSNEVLFKIEKYFRVIAKENIEDEQLKQDMFNFLENNRGVVDFETLEKLIGNIKAAQYGDKFISEVLGTATIPVGNPEQYDGSIGIKQGLRIVMRLPKDSAYFPENLTHHDLTEEEKVFSTLEKTYFSKYAQMISADSVYKNISIPICSVELDIKDQKISEFSITDGENKYDLDCLLNKITETAEYKLMFDYLAPIKVPTSLVMVNCVNFFVPSIGIDDGWVEEEGVYEKKKKDLESTALKETNLLCRKYFCSFYESTKFNNSENWRLPKIEIPDFFNLLFGSFTIPSISLSLDLLIPDLAFDHKIIQENPLNKDKEICPKDVDKFIE